MGVWESLISGVPAIAGHPLAFLAYIVVILAWTTSTMQRARIKEVLTRIENIPEKDRKAIVETTLGLRLPASVDTEAWLRSRRQTMIFYSFLATLLTALVFGYYAYRAGQDADLVIDDVRTPSLSNLFVGAAYAQEIPMTRAELVDWGVSLEDSVYAFDVTLRNPSNSVVTVTEIRVDFDEEVCGALASTEEITGVYITWISENNVAVTTSPDRSRYEADAWYPSPDGKCLIVVTPLSQSLQPNEVDRFRVLLAFPVSYEFRGPMATARLSMIWNNSEHVETELINLPSASE